MQTILIGFAARHLTEDLPELDARQLRDIGVTRALDGSLRLLDDPSVEAAPHARPVKSGGSWGAWLAGFLVPYSR
jgi:hypothetical protein